MQERTNRRLIQFDGIEASKLILQFRLVWECGKADAIIGDGNVFGGLFSLVGSGVGGGRSLQAGIRRSGGRLRAGRQQGQRDETTIPGNLHFSAPTKRGPVNRTHAGAESSRTSVFVSPARLLNYLVLPSEPKAMADLS